MKKYDVQAFLDRELPDDRQKEICAHMQRDESLQLYYGSIAYQKLLLKQWWYAYAMHKDKSP